MSGRSGLGEAPATDQCLPNDLHHRARQQRRLRAEVVDLPGDADLLIAARDASQSRLVEGRDDRSAVG